MLLAALAGAALLAGSVASAQYSRAPFFEQTLVQSQAYGLQLAMQRLDALELAGDDLDDDFLEVVEGLEQDLARFMGTLRSADPELADAVEEAVEAVEEAAASGDGLEDAIAEARAQLEAAYEVVIPAEVRSDPVFTAALIVDLSLGEGGVGEGYEEAVEGELGAYTMGYAALQRVSELWGEIADVATEQQRADVEEMLDFLGTIYPEPTIEEAIVGNPEEAEAPVQRMIGVLETVVDAELFPGRDLAALAAHLPEELAGYCQAYEAGDDEVALEGAIAVSYLYLTDDLGQFLGFMDPEVHEEALELIGALTGLEAEEEGEEAGEGDDEEEDEEERPAVEDPAAACRELQEVFRQAHEVLGG